MMKIAYPILALIFGVLPAKAAMTDWTAVQGGAVRLISAGPLEDGYYLAGLEFSLDPGWHTYWRYPGEAGIPPQITLKDTSNLRSYQVLYPAPQRYDDGFSKSIVYQGGIVLPIRLVPENPGQPLRLSLDLFFGICKEICVPGEAQEALELTPDARRDALAAKLIDRDLSTVPGFAPAGPLEIRSIALLEGAEGSLAIEAGVAAGGGTDLFAAGPEGSYIGLPVLKQEKNGTAVWHLSTKGLKTAAGDTDLRLVLTSGGNVLEQLIPIHPDWTK
jgi:DsbC/DsbD-like thiol-disulfide interchange protein